MRTNRWDAVLAIAIVVAVGIACNYSASTANISSLKVGKDASVSAETDKFSSDDTIYANAVISNASEKLKVTGRLLAENVEGVPKGLVPGAENSVDMTGSGTAKFNFTAGQRGWPKGTYTVEILMKNEAGEQKDQKTATIKVS